jgi:type II secretory pathway predicted ATPase ExeA
MYTSFYGLRKKPFSMAPDSDFFYESHQHGAALTVLDYGIREGYGMVLLTGEAGSGKTMLSEYLINKIICNGNRDQGRVAQVSNTGGNAESLIEFVLLAFGLDPGNSHAGNLNLLKEHAKRLIQKGVRPIIVIDEAQQLSKSQMEQVRMLTNLLDQGQYLLHIIIVSQPEIREVLNRPDFQHMAQRIAVSYNLLPLSFREIVPYIRHRLQAAGATNPDIFTEGAMDLISKHSRGLPRLINILCDAALVTGYAEGRQVIDEECVHRVVMNWESAAFGLQPGLNRFQPEHEPHSSRTGVFADDVGQTDFPRHTTVDSDNSSVLLKQLQGQKMQLNGFENIVQRNFNQLEQTLERNEEERKKIIESRVKETKKDLDFVSSDLNTLRNDIGKVSRRFEKVASVFQNLDGEESDSPASGKSAENGRLPDDQAAEVSMKRDQRQNSAAGEQLLPEMLLPDDDGRKKASLEKKDHQQTGQPSATKPENPSPPGGGDGSVPGGDRLRRLKRQQKKDRNETSNERPPQAVNGFFKKVQTGRKQNSALTSSFKTETVPEPAAVGSEITPEHPGLEKNSLLIISAGALVVLLQILLVWLIF